MDVPMATAAAGVTSAIGAVCLIAYYFSQGKTESTHRSIVDVTGHHDNRAQVLQLLAGLTTDEAKIRALRDYYKFSESEARRLLSKVKDNVDVTRINQTAATSHSPPTCSSPARSAPSPTSPRKKLAGPVARPSRKAPKSRGFRAIHPLSLPPFEPIRSVPARLVPALRIKRITMSVLPVANLLICLSTVSVLQK